MLCNNSNKYVYVCVYIKALGSIYIHDSTEHSSVAGLSSHSKFQKLRSVREKNFKYSGKLKSCQGAATVLRNFKLLPSAATQLHATCEYTMLDRSPRKLRQCHISNCYSVKEIIKESICCKFLKRLCKFYSKNWFKFKY